MKTKNIKKIIYRISFPVLLSILFLLNSEVCYATEIEEYDSEINIIENEEDSLLNTMKINLKNLSIITKSEYDFSNKKITCLGDSITYGNGGSDNGHGGQISYCDFLAKTLNTSVVNLGIGGSAIGDYWDETSLILRWQDIPHDSDIIIIMAGINDFFIGPEHFGDVNSRERETYCGDTYSLFCNIKNSYPNADIFIVTTFKNNAENWEPFKEYNMQQYMDVQKQYANELGLNIIEIYETGFMNSQIPEIKESFIPDDVHPNDNGNEILANKLAAELCIHYNS